MPVKVYLNLRAVLGLKAVDEVFTEYCLLMTLGGANTV